MNIQDEPLPFTALADFEKVMLWLHFADEPNEMRQERQMAWVLFDGQTDRLSDALRVCQERGFIKSK